MQIDKSTLKKLALIVGGGILLNWVLHNFGIVLSGFDIIRGLFAPFIVGLIIAYLLNIPMMSIERLLFKKRSGKAKRPVSFVLSLLAVLTVLSLIIFLIVPQLVQTIKMLIDSMPGYLARLQKNLAPFEEYIPQIETFINNLKIDWDSLSQDLINLATSGAGNAASWVFGFASSLISGTTSFIIGFIFACYVLLGKEHLLAQTNGLMQAYLPEKKYSKLMEVLSLANRIFSKFVSGQCTEALAITLMFFIVLTIGGFKYSLLISVLVGVFSFIPVFGAFIACAIGALLILISTGFWRTIAFIIVFLVVQQIDGNFIYPRIIGSSISLPPLWVLVAVSVGGGLMGMFGMLLFIPIVSLLYTLLHRNANARLKKKGIPSPVLSLQNKQASAKSSAKPKKGK